MSLGRRLRDGVGRIVSATGAIPPGSRVIGPSGPAEVPDLVEGPQIHHDPALDAEPCLVVLMPHLSVARMTGGPNTVFQVTERLAARDIAVRYVACFGPLDTDIARLRHHLADVTGLSPIRSQFIDCSGAGAELAVGAGDVILATWWPTAHVARRALAVTAAREFIYLIQDFEPGFHPWSTKYALASATYLMPVRAVVNEPTLLEHLREQGQTAFDATDPTRAITFMPAVDRALFRPRERQPGPFRLAFYARPGHPRNLFELGLRALADAVERGAFEGHDWIFAAIGEETRSWRLSARHTIDPVRRLTYQEYAAFLAQSDILLSLMLSPHTSYPPLEMATTGGLVVTNTFGTKTASALAAISPSIRGVQPDLDSLSSAIADAARDVVVGRLPTSTTLPEDWNESLSLVIPWLEATIATTRQAGVT